jgi:hypothetical protein
MIRGAVVALIAAVALVALYGAVYWGSEYLHSQIELAQNQRRDLNASSLPGALQ